MRERGHLQVNHGLALFFSSFKPGDAGYVLLADVAITSVRIWAWWMREPGLLVLGQGKQRLVLPRGVSTASNCGVRTYILQALRHVFRTEPMINEFYEPFFLERRQEPSAEVRPLDAIRSVKLGKVERI